jgi:hypothetical protein
MRILTLLGKSPGRARLPVVPKGLAKNLALASEETVNGIPPLLKPSCKGLKWH